jgi:hypothetical protein
LIVLEDEMSETREIANRRFSEPARRRGAIYCSPWCGCGCTWAEYAQATEEADALVKRLGDGWSARVWENGGWNYEAIRGVCEVKPTKFRRSGDRWVVDGYRAWIQTRPQYISQRCATPEDALREAMLMMKAAFDQLAASFNEGLQIGIDMKLIAPAVTW